MKSLHTRLDPVKDEVIEVTRKWGRGRAMDTFGVRDLPGFDRWLKEKTGVQNFGVRPLFGYDGPQALLTQALEYFCEKIVTLTREIEDLREENRQLREQLQPRTEHCMEKMGQLIEVCGPRRISAKEGTP